MKCRLFLMPAGRPRCTVVVAIGNDSAHVLVMPTGETPPIRNGPTTRVHTYPTSDLANDAATKCHELLVRFSPPPRRAPTTPGGSAPGSTPRGVS